MEIRKGINDTIRGERVVGIYPPLVPAGQTGWQRRLNLYTGRSLSASALETEQIGRAGQLTTRAQSVSPGVIMGLEVELENPPAGAEDGLQAAFLSIAPGYGLSTTGEDLLIPSARRIAVGSLLVRGAVLADETPTLLNLRDRGELGTVSPIGVLRLCPVILPTAGEFNEFDPCEENERNDAYEDQQLADAAILEYFPLPEDFFTGAPPTLGGTSLAAVNRWRNLIAYGIFTREQTTLAPELMPWEVDGVAIGVIGFANDWTPIFVDRASVVRAGGKPKRRTRLQPARGSAFLWQARLEQLAEQIASPQLAGLATPAIGALFHFLPPAGIIPADALDFSGDAPQNRFFPAHFGVDAVPIPVDQLDVAFEASAALDPFDTRFTDYVRMLVPVPAHLYEPRLLQREFIDPIFGETITAFKTRRDELLGRRAFVRQINTLYVRTLTGKAPTFPAESTPVDEAPTEPPFDPAELEYDTAVSDDGVRGIPAFAQLRDQLVALIGQPNVDNDNEKGLNIGRDGLQEYIVRLKQAADTADDNIDIGFLRVQTDIYRVRQLVLGTDVAAKLVTSSALAAIVTDEKSSYATRESLREYVQQIKGRAGGAVRSVAVSTDSTPENRDSHVVDIPISANLGNAPSLDSSNVPRRSVSELSDLFRIGNRPEISDLLDAITDRPQISAELQHATRAAKLGAEFGVILPKDPPKEAVEEQSPLIGSYLNLRDTTVGQRLEQSSALSAKDNTRATQFEIIDNLKKSSIFENLEVPIIKDYNEETWHVSYDKVRLTDFDPQQVFQVATPGQDELAYFNASIDVIDVSVATLRAAEARVKSFRDAISLAETNFSTFQRTLQQVNSRLSEIGDELAEARHDVSVAEALRDEEQNRLDAINTRRQRILRNEVKFLAYIRPRSTATILSTPLRSVDPGYTPPAVPACLLNPQTVPPELRAMIDLFRDVPIRWLGQMPKLLDRLDRVELLQELVVTGIARAKTPTRIREILFQNSSFGGNLGQAIARTYTAQQQTVAVYRTALAQFDPQTLRGRTWKQIRDVAVDTTSLDDLVDAGHGQSDVAQQALRELDDMAQVAACLYKGFGTVRPVLRLRWAETLSQYDEAVNLRNLTSLADWGTVDVLERRQLQQLVDWLHNAIDPNVPQAVAMINDLIRVCLLLASHAPVNQLISATVALPTPVLPGRTLTLNVDLARVKIGMNVLIYDKVDTNKVVAQAVIDDLTDSVAAAKVIVATQPNLQVDKDTLVMISPAQELALVTQSHFLNVR